MLGQVDKQHKMLSEYLCRETYRLIWLNGVISPDFKGELIVVSNLAYAGVFYGEVDFADRSEYGVNRDLAYRHVVPLILIGGNIASAGFYDYFHIELSALVQRCNVQVGIYDLNVGIDYHVPCLYFAGAGSIDDDLLCAIAMHLHAKLFEVEDYLSYVFSYAGNSGELVEHTVDLNRGYRYAGQRRKQHAAE